MKNLIFIMMALLSLNTNLLFGQTAEQVLREVPIISKAPVSFRVNESGSKLHGYYKKGYDLTIYGDNTAAGFRADCDKDDDWSNAIVGGTTQSGNNFEMVFKRAFNPHILYGTVLPGNKKGQSHYDKLKSASVGIGDLTLTYKLDKNNKPSDSIIGVVFDRGPQNQPGESSVATCNKFESSLDNNQFVYIIFPNTAKFIKQIIGTNNVNFLKRDPTNADFEKAFELMLKDVSASKRIEMQKNILRILSQIPILANFDNATPQQKAEGKLKAKNNDRNLN